MINLDDFLSKKEITAKELKKLLFAYGWMERQPPKNQPHFYKLGVRDYIVVDERYGLNTIQKIDRWRKYVKRIKENL
jgi:hypothetical protein